MHKNILMKGVAVFMLLLLPSLTMRGQIDEGEVFTLPQIYDLASQNSKQLKLSESYIDLARKATSVAKNGRLPSIDASLSVSYLGDATILDREFTDATRAPMPHFGNNFSLQASQVIFAGGAISNSIKKAELQEQVAKLNKEKAEMDIRFLLTSYYLDLYKLLNLRRIYVKNIEQTELLIEQIKAKHREGMALSNDVTRHELTLQNYHLALIEIENNYAILNNNMVVTLGLPQNTVIKPDTTLLSTKYDRLSNNNLLSVAEHNLPELKSTKVNMDISTRDIKLARSSMLPSIALVAANNFDGPIIIEVPPINKNLNYWYVGVGVKYSFSSLYKSRKAVRLAKVQQYQATEMHAIAKERTEIAIHSDSTRYNEAFTKLDTYAKSLELANENFRIVNNRYINDLVLITEMLDASNTKLNAEIQVANAKINIIYNYYKLQRTIGKL